ncbi:MFS transporter [Rhodococcus sp. WAY2]|uniref:MFS transporter n=1 Tax=Rhodococcus sp. WAY2 TaxID=2663121 RepID=UPI00135A4877|nr:MFS transporter [Rhodococcus sp. WAY2]
MSTKPAVDAPAPTEVSPPLVVLMLSLCGTVVSLQQTLFLPLLAELPLLLNTSAGSASWLVTSTLLAGAVATPTISRLADMYGKRRMMLLALGVSVAGSLIGSLSSALPLLVLARSLQGAGVALVPVGIAIMRDQLPRDRVPLGVAWMSATLAIGAGAGLPLSGLISAHLDWHGCFWVTGIMGALMMIGARLVIPESAVRTGGAFDVRGALLLSVALTALFIALSQGGEWGWGSPLSVGLALGGLATLAVWVPVELRTPRPLVDVRIATRRAVLLVNVASVFAGFATYMNMLVSIQILQLPTSTGYGLGLDVLHAALWMVPTVAAFALLAPVSAWSTRRFGPQVTLIAGSALMVVTYVGRVFMSDSVTQVVIGSVLVGAGNALVYSSMPTLVMRAVPVTETASANGLNVLLRSVGTSAASAATAAATTSLGMTVAGTQLLSFDSLTLLFWLSAAAAAITVLLGLPMLSMEEYAAEADRSGAEHRGADAQVVTGLVLDPRGDPIRSAVVSVLTIDGQAVDWGPVDTKGRFTVAIPEAGDYLVVTAADGWRPRSRVMHMADAAALPPIGLRDRLTLTGVVANADDDPVVDALVVMTRRTGEMVGSIRTDHEGRYAMPRPISGRYVVTVAAREGQIGARAVTVLDAARDIDMKLGAPLA